MAQREEEKRSMYRLSFIYRVNLTSQLLAPADNLRAMDSEAPEVSKHPSKHGMSDRRPSRRASLTSRFLAPANGPGATDSKSPNQPKEDVTRGMYILPSFQSDINSDSPGSGQLLWILRGNQLQSWSEKSLLA